MGLCVKANGAEYFFAGSTEEAQREYERFQGCLLQLTDDSSMEGNMEGRWVIFQCGWVYGLASYATQQDAAAFAKQIFRDEPNANYIIVQVDPDQHALSAMHLLASALSDVESNKLRGQKKVWHPEVPVEDESDDA